MPTKQTDPLPPAAEKAAYVREMFGRIARRYDLMNRLMTLGRDRAWRGYTVGQVLRALAPPDGSGGEGGRVLDVATGTGDLAFEVLRQRPGARVIGLDFVPEMLALAREKASRLRVSPPWLASDALHLPFPAGFFDAVVTGFALRNVTDIPATFAEMARVTRPGGRLACLEITKPRSALFRRLFNLYFYHLVPLVGGWITGQQAAYTYLPHSLTGFLAPDEIAEVMRRTGWQDVGYRRLMLGTVAVHVGTRRQDGTIRTRGSSGEQPDGGKTPRKRRRRIMRKWLIVAGGIVLLLVAVFILLLLASSHTGGAFEPVASNAPSAPMEVQRAVVSMAEGEAASGYAPDADESQTQVDRMIIWNANISLTVEDTEAAIGQAQAVAQSLGGYTVATESWKSDDQLYARLTLRVPADKFEMAMTQLRDLALEVNRESANSEDVTEQYVDLESRLRHLEAKEVQLTKIMEDAKDTEAVLAVYDHLAETQAEIEQVKGQMAYLEKLSAMATINVELYPEEAPPKVVDDSWQPGFTLRNAARALVNTLKAIGDVLIWLAVYLLPILLLLAIPVAIVVWVVRRRRRKQPGSSPQ